MGPKLEKSSETVCLLSEKFERTWNSSEVPIFLVIICSYLLEETAI
jgi:hypothetical protein